MRCVVLHQVIASSTVLLPIAPEAIQCGYPSPAQDYYDGPIDLTERLVEDQAATFIVRAAGESMIGAGVSAGDEILVDRSRRPRDGDVVVAVLDGELTIKRLRITGAGVVLQLLDVLGRLSLPDDLARLVDRGPLPLVDVDGTGPIPACVDQVSQLAQILPMLVLDVVGITQI